MLNGYAFLVEYPRRKEQNYVCCDAKYVANDLTVSIRNLDWPVRVSLISYRGPDARQIMTTIHDVLVEIPEVLHPRLKRENGVLSFRC